MKDEALSWCREQSLFADGDRVICAVSGGADSMAMLWCLHSFREELHISVSAAHFNHCLRGSESDRDEVFVRSFCERNGIRFFSGRADVAAYAAQNGMTLEEAAREKRYEFLRSLDCDKIATAHNADDNAETVLLHLLRGSGLRGLCGVPPKRGKIVRPMLAVSRAEIIAFLKKEGLSWQEDSTNSADDCLRNRLRHHVMPLLYEESPDLPQKLRRQSELLRGEDALLDAMAKELVEYDGEAYRIAPLLSAEDALQKRALRLILREYLPQDVAQNHISSLQELLYSEKPSAQLSLPDGLTAQRRYDTFAIIEEAPAEFSEIPLCIPGVTYLSELKTRITCTLQEKPENFKNTPFQFAVKYDMIANSVLCVRPRRSGDRMKMDGGYSKTLKKWMIEQKIPRFLRRQMPVLAEGENVIAVLGLGVSADYRADGKERVLLISTEKEENQNGD